MTRDELLLNMWSIAFWWGAFQSIMMMVSLLIHWLLNQHLTYIQIWLQAWPLYVTLIVTYVAYLKADEARGAK